MKRWLHALLFDEDVETRIIIVMLVLWAVGLLAYHLWCHCAN